MNLNDRNVLLYILLLVKQRVIKIVTKLFQLHTFFHNKCSTRIIKSNIPYQLVRDFFFFPLSSDVLQDY